MLVLPDDVTAHPLQVWEISVLGANLKDDFLLTALLAGAINPSTASQQKRKGPWGPYLNQFPAGATKVLGAIRGDRITPVKDGSQRGVSSTARSTANEARLS